MSFRSSCSSFVVRHVNISINRPRTIIIHKHTYKPANGNTLKLMSTESIHQAKAMAFFLSGLGGNFFFVVVGVVSSHVLVGLFFLFFSSYSKVMLLLPLVLLRVFLKFFFNSTSFASLLVPASCSSCASLSSWLASCYLNWRVVSCSRQVSITILTGLLFWEPDLRAARGNSKEQNTQGRISSGNLFLYKTSFGPCAQRN